MLKNELKKFDICLLAIYDTRSRPGSTLDFPNDLKLFIAEIAKLNTITTVLGNPYSVAGLPGLEESKGLIIGYENSKQMEISAAKLLLGKIKAKGKLPVTINSFFKYGDGIESK